MTTTEKNNSALIHISTLSQYFIPFGNYIFPVLIWSSKKEQSEFINNHGKSVLNFQLSTFLYSLILLLIAIPTFIFGVFNNSNFENWINKGDHNFSIVDVQNFSNFLIVLVIAIMLFLLLKFAEFILIILGAVKASNGEEYNYPLTIKFIK